MSNIEVLAEVNNQDCSRARYFGYTHQDEYQKDLKRFYDEKICGALNKEGKFCKKPPLENGRCKFHGGMSVRGVAHPNYKNGIYSKYIPKDLLNKYKEASSDDELLSLRNEAALLTTRIMELVENSSNEAGRQSYKKLIEHWDNWQEHERMGSDKSMYYKVKFENLLSEISEDLRIWDEITMVVESKRKIVDSEQKKMKTMNQYVPVEKVMLLVGALMDIVITEVESLEGILVDKKMIEDKNMRIARKFRDITNRKEGMYGS